jgi:hypothetical protein
MITISGGVLRGVINGMCVTCYLKSGVDIPKGSYKLLSAGNDPFFGAVVMMLPIASSGRSGGVSFEGIKHEGIEYKPYIDKSYLKQVRMGDPSHGFVLSTKTMPGKNNIVIYSGFSDLVEGLAKGEAIVEVG